jgi:hypothetical protein
MIGKNASQKRNQELGVMREKRSRGNPFAVHTSVLCTVESQNLRMFHLRRLYIVET